MLVYKAGGGMTGSKICRLYNQGKADTKKKHACDMLRDGAPSPSKCNSSWMDEGPSLAG